MKTNPGLQIGFYFLCAVAIAIAPSSLNAGSSVDSRILRSDGTGVVVEFTPAFSPPETLRSSNGAFIRYRVDDCVPSVSQLPGSPELLSRSILVRFPGEDGNSVEVVSADYENISNVFLAPVPSYRRGELGPVAVREVNATAYAHNVFAPDSLASLARIGETRGTILGTLNLSPVQYNPATRTLRKYSRIVVRINFGPPTSTVQGDDLSRGRAINDLLPSPLAPERNASVLGKRTAGVSSVLSSGVWYRFPITEDGMYRITGRMLLDAGVPASIDPRTIKIFGNGGYELPLSPAAPSVDDLLQNAITISDGGTQGQLDPSDYLVFYGKGTRGWNYSPASKSFTHYINHYTETNVYWLTYGGSPARQMTQVPSQNQTGISRQSTVSEKMFREDEKVNVASSGIEWLGQSFGSGDQMTYVYPLSGLDGTQPVRYRFHLASGAPTFSGFSIREHSSQLLNVSLPPVSGGDFGPIVQDAMASALIIPNQVPGFTNAQSQLQFQYATNGASGNGYIDWVELFYSRFLTAQADLLHISAPDTSATLQFLCTRFSGNLANVYDVTRYDSVVALLSPYVAADTCLFGVSLTSGASREFFVVGPNGWKTPGALTRVTNQNLHGDTTQVPYIIITHPDFLSAAQRLKTYREQSTTGSLRGVVVTTEQIYNEFGAGLPSPIAIRNYLRYCYNTWTVPPRFVLLFGDGDFDYKRIMASGPNWIPPFESSQSFYPFYSYASEDDFVTFNSGNLVDMGIGRLAVRSLQEANAMVDKIVRYETQPVRDLWKTRCTLVADDGLQGVLDGRLVNDGFSHTNDAEAAAALIPGLFEKKKIYEYAYPTIYTAGGRRKPDVNVAIDNQINEGTLLLNYTGHGNPRLWAHENVFVRESDFPKIHNQGKYFFLVAATCDYSHFDELNDQSGGELLVAMQDAGAIAALSACRSVYQDRNARLNQAFFRNLFSLNSEGRLVSKRLGDVYYGTKLVGTGDPINDKKYLLLGDPALILSFPKLFASVDSINHQSASQVIKLRALEHASVNASVLDSSSGGGSAFSGQAQIVVNDANGSLTLTDPDLQLSEVIQTAGSVLFRGQASITNGKLSSQFIVPKDISHSNQNGRIALYFSNAATDGAGSSSNILISGVDSTAPSDTKGPEIHLAIDRQSFRPGDIVSASPVLIAGLADSNGINTSGSGIGHRIEMWLDNAAQSTDLSDFYRSNNNTFREGSIEYPLGSLSEGTHRLRLRAWDTYDNSSTGETVFNVMTGVGLQLSNVFNYPNPLAGPTVFTFNHNQVTPIEAEVKIYTVAGRLIQSLKESNVVGRFVRIPWDGHDKDGDFLANGIYLYKVIAKTQDGRFRAEAYGKMSVMK